MLSTKCLSNREKAPKSEIFYLTSMLILKILKENLISSPMFTSSLMWLIFLKKIFTSSPKVSQKEILS